jgi:hypothetical protein
VLADVSSARTDVRDVAFGWRQLLEGEGPEVSRALLSERVFVGGRGVLGVNLAAAASAGIDLDNDEDLLDEKHAPSQLRGLVLDRLRELDETLPVRLEGAWERVTRPGPDAASQAASSLVELLDWSLKRATNDDELLVWHKMNQRPSSELDHGGRPTRSLRVRYLCRNEPSGDLIDAFVRITTETYGSLQGVKHKPRVVDPIVVRRLIPAVEAVLTFVLAR